MANLFVILLFKDLMYLNDFEESVGTIIKSTTKTTDIDKKKPAISKRKFAIARRFITALSGIRL